MFSTILARGKDFAFLQSVDDSARRPVAYASQRFASSSYEQWLKIEKSYYAFRKAFDILHPNRDRNEELQYMIAGSDFVADLLAFLDILARAQSLDTPIWKLKLWWPKVKAKVTKAANGCATAFEQLEKAARWLLGVPLLEGWLVTNNCSESSNSPKAR